MKRTSALYNSMIGIGGLVACTVLLVCAAALLLSPRQHISLDALKKENVQACTVSLQSSGFEVKRDGSSLQAKMLGLEGYREKLLKSSLAISACDNLRLVNYCMGNCKDPTDEKGLSANGTFMRLSYFDPILK
jgi:hypothetical protein